jgi:negative regulator of flagellin synthesis FlgM
MGIEISGNNGRALNSALETGKSQATSPQDTASRATSTGKSASSGGDEIKLSNQAAQLQALEAEIANLPVVDTQRVQDVQQTIATGSFQIEPAQVADKMLSFEAGLGETPK